MNTKYGNKSIDESNEEMATYFVAKWNIVRSFFRNFDIFASILDKISIIASVAHSVLNIFTMLPAILGPITLMLSIVELFTSTQVSLASKLIGLFANTGATTTNIVALFLQNIAMPLLLVGASLGVAKELWTLFELYVLSDSTKPVPKIKRNESLHDLAVASITLLGVGLTFIPFPPLMIIGYVILAVIGIYRLVDSLGYNPLRTHTNLFKEDTSPDVSADREGTSAKLTHSMQLEESESETNEATLDEVTLETIEVEEFKDVEVVRKSPPLHTYSMFSHSNEVNPAALKTMEDLASEDLYSRSP